MRGPKGTERLIIQTPGGLITREVPLRGDLGKDIQAREESLGSRNRRKRQEPDSRQPSQILERLRDPPQNTDRKPDAEHQPLAPPALTTTLAPNNGPIARMPAPNREDKMDDPIYKVVEVVGTSERSSSKAIDNAINKASGTLRNLGWFEVAQMRGAIKDGKVQRYQVTLKVGFTLE